MSSATARASASGSSVWASAVALAGESGWRRTDTSRIAPSDAERAREQLGQVVPGHVLDDLAARPWPRVPSESATRHAHHEVADAAVAGSQRAGVARGHHTARRGPSVRRVEREHLPGLGEGLLRRGERHAGLEHRGEVPGVVLQDPVEAGGGDVHPGRAAATAAQSSFVPAPRTRTASPAAAAAAQLGGQLLLAGRLEPGGRPPWPSEALAQARPARPGGAGKGPAPRRRAAAWASPCPGWPARRGRTRSAGAGTCRGRRRRTSSACSASCPRPRRARR